MFLLEYFPIISFHCHATCMCTTENRPHLVLFTAKLVFVSEQSISFSWADVRSHRDSLPRTVLTSCMCLLKHSKHYKNRKTKQHAEAKGDKGRAVAGVSILWRKRILSSKRNKNKLPQYSRGKKVLPGQHFFSALLGRQEQKEDNKTGVTPPDGSHPGAKQLAGDSATSK